MLLPALLYVSSDLLSVVIVMLATWRVSHMLVHEYGPRGMLQKFRALTGIQHDIDGNPSWWPTGNMLVCVWCTSVWVAIALLILPMGFSMVFALSAVACIIEGVESLL